MDRVNEYAKKVEAKTYPGPPKGSSFEAGMEHNRQWLRQQKKDGAEIIDIGPDFNRRLDRARRGSRPDSQFYNMERTETKNYPNRKKVFRRNERFQGGVDGLD